ncbi:MAG: hypothetical protein ACR5LC_04295 [Symbiopectobacterium sp.]|uniref:hypothetical protein n=1 Tax=Symbiopectobacterium sp. TaxID=2952789 RepID=UPI003F36EF6D
MLSQHIGIKISHQKGGHVQRQAQGPGNTAFAGKTVIGHDPSSRQPDQQAQHHRTTDQNRRMQQIKRHPLLPQC